MSNERSPRDVCSMTIGIKRRLEEIIAKHTEQDLEKVSRDMERDYFMTAQEAQEYGIIDTVVSSRDSRPS